MESNGVPPQSGHDGAASRQGRADGAPLCGQAALTAPHHSEGRLACSPRGKIERWHQTMKSRILLEYCYLPGDLEAQVGAFVDYYNHRRYHESVQNINTGRCLLRPRKQHLGKRGGHQKPNNRTTPLGASTCGRLNYQPRSARASVPTTLDLSQKS